MGKKGGWFSAVKKAFATESKEKKEQVLMGWDSNFYGLLFSLCFWLFKIMN